MLTNELTQEVVVAQPELCLEGRRLRSIWAAADDREKWAALKAHKVECLDCTRSEIARLEAGVWVSFGGDPTDRLPELYEREQRLLDAEGGRPDLGETLSLADKIDRAMAVQS